MGEIVWKRSLQLIVKSVAYVAHRICSSLDKTGELNGYLKADFLLINWFHFTIRHDYYMYDIHIIILIRMFSV